MYYCHIFSIFIFYALAYCLFLSKKVAVFIGFLSNQSENRDWLPCIFLQSLKIGVDLIVKLLYYRNESYSCKLSGHGKQLYSVSIQRLVLVRTIFKYYQLLKLRLLFPQQVILVNKSALSFLFKKNSTSH
jgi:hypothetical protein